MNFMLLTIKTSEEAWTSPDGQRKIWEIVDSEGNKWQTMSRQIAQSINQTMELTTRVSDKGKTYLVKPSIDGVGAPQAASTSLESTATDQLLQQILEELKKLNGSATIKGNVESDLPPVESYNVNEQMAEVFDDL